MDVTKIPVLSKLVARMDFLAARSTVVAQNIANADTPGYVAKDISKDFKSLAANAAAMRTNDPRHLQSARADASAYRIESAPDPDAALNGNKVSLETQAMKLSQTRQQYALASSLYRKGVSMLRLAARGQ